MSPKLKKREWCYCQYPSVYEVSCDQCGGTHTTWSEYEKHIWCFDCEIDTLGTPGIFGGPIPLHACEALGICFDRIILADNSIVKTEDYIGLPVPK